MPIKTHEIQGFLGKAIEMEGELKFDGTMRIDGVFKGSIHTPGGLLIGEGAHVEADLRCGTVTVAGEVIGDIQATERIEAQPPARIVGNIQAPRLQINEGVHFEGNARMGKPVEANSGKEGKVLFPGKEERYKWKDLPMQEQVKQDSSENGPV